MKHLKEFSDSELIERLVTLAQQEREMLAEVLRYLREVENRDLFLELGYSSLFVFCVDRLGYSEGEAHSRVQAMRLIKNVPEAESAITQGLLTLTVAAGAQKHFRRAEKAKDPVPVEVQKDVVASLCGATTREAEKRLAHLFPDAPPREKVRMLAQGRVSIEFTVEESLWNRMEELRSIRSHKNPAKRWDLFIADMTELAWKKWHPLAKGNAALLEAPQVTPQQNNRNAFHRK